MVRIIDAAGGAPCRVCATVCTRTPPGGAWPGRGGSRQGQNPPMDWLVGDVQGCDASLQRLLQVVGFSPSRDHVVVLGDLVNRGPDSAAVLQRLRALGGSASAILGNHDLHLLAVAAGARATSAQDTLGDVLLHPDRDGLLRWLQRRPLALERAGWLCVHAGVIPDWDAAQTLALADEAARRLQEPDAASLLRQMYEPGVLRWDPALQGLARWRLVVDVLTRIRFCHADGTLDLKTKEGAAAAPPGCSPWFDMPARRTAGTPLAFGHWSTLGFLQRDDLLGLDTGCVWGGCLTAVRVDGGRSERVQVSCPQAQHPGRA
jgi:bis(5'-nucleosyl)-tetraphosphatase (symmetrical)